MLHVGGNATSIGFILITNLLPTIILGPLAGAIADKVSNKIFLYISFLVKVLTFIIIPTVNNHQIIYLMSFILSCTTVISLPILKNTLNKIVISEDHLMNINSSVLSLRSIIEIIVPIFGSTIAILLGFNIAFYLCSIFYSLAILFVFLIKVNKIESSSYINNKESFAAKIKEGFNYIYFDKPIRRIVTLTISIMFFSSTLNILLPIHLLTHLEIDKSSYGLVLSCLGIGSAFGSILIPRITKGKHILNVLTISLIFDGIFMILLGNSLKNIIIILVIMLFLGITSSFYFIIIETHLQTIVKKNFIGRVFSTYYMLVNIFSLLSIAIFSSIIDSLGSINIFTICGIGIIISSVLFMIKKTQTLTKEEKASI